MDDFEIETNNDLDFELKHIHTEFGGFISVNRAIFDNLFLSDSTKIILEESVGGTVMVKMGHGSPRVMVVSGVHGNELPPQIASCYLIDYLLNSEINGTVYIVPFAAPRSSMESKRRANHNDLNRAAHREGSVTNAILKEAIELRVSALGDFHSTAPNTNPGKESVFASRDPSSESLAIADYIAGKMGSVAIKSNKAGVVFKGALEDESNLAGIPSVTCEAFSPVSFANKKYIERSFFQMLYFLEYFGILVGDLDIDD